MVGLIRLAGAVVAVAGPRRYYLVPKYAALPADDDRRRLAILMCAYFHRLTTGPHPAPYTDEDAEAYARYVLAQLDRPASLD